MLSSRYANKITSNNDNVDLCINNSYLNHDFRKNDKNDDISYFDNIFNLTDLEIIHRYITTCSWMKHWSCGPSNTFFFKNSVVKESMFSNLFYNKIIPNINFEGKEKLKFIRAYINLHIPGIPGDWHQDNPGLGPTIIVYLDKKWDLLYEGQTAFILDSASEINTTPYSCGQQKHNIKYVEHCPGRVVVFKPYLTHRACDMSRYASDDNVSRHTLAFHTYFAH